jgi:hypothetical protein
MPHVIGHQTIAELMHLNGEDHKAESSSSPMTRFAHDFSRIPVYSQAPVSLQTKLVVNTPGDIYEQEADRVSEQVTSVPEPQLQRACACGGACPRCGDKQAAHDQMQTERVRSTDSGEIAAPHTVHEVLDSPGQPLDPTTREFMEPRFGHDFSRVRVHTDGAAVSAARDVQARAYTVGRDIVFGSGQYAPSTAEGKKLLAHELTHVVQQSHTKQSSALQRQATFIGGPGTTAKEKDRPLVGYEGPLLYQPDPGGTTIPNTASTAQNCAGDSCSINKYINWPHLGYEVPNVKLPANVQGDWGKATNFVPSGCTRVNCSGINEHYTRCNYSELELLTYLYSWPVALTIKDQPMAGSQSDFHMVGRNANSLPGGWHSKPDRREKIADIRDPLQSLYNAYPHTKQKDRTIQQICFCCNQAAIKTT